MTSQNKIQLTKNISGSNRKQIKGMENIKNTNIANIQDIREIKKELKFTTYTPLNQLKELSESELMTNLDTVIRQEYFNKDIESIPENRESLWNIVKNEEAISKHFILKEYDTQTDKDKVGALIIRIKRFRLKYGMIAYMIQYALKPVKALRERMSYIETALMKRSVIIKFTESSLSAELKQSTPNCQSSKDMGLTTNTSVIINVTLSSTISLINKSLVEFESILKQLLPGLIEMYNLPLIYPDGQPFISFQHSLIVDSLRSIAPRVSYN